METMCGKERIRMRKICLGQSIQGASHKRTGKECQDFFKVDVQKDYIILAVADGHGINPVLTAGLVQFLLQMCFTM